MLDRQKIVIPLSSGIDTKTDPKQVPAGKLLELENGVFTSVQAIQKRSGHVALGQSIVGNNTGAKVSSALGLATYADELLLADGNDLYSYDQANDAWIDKGRFVSVTAEKFSVVRNTTLQKNQDGVTHSSGMELYAWEDYAGSPLVRQGIRYCIVDGATGQIVVPSALLSATGIKPRVLVSNNVFLIYYYDTSSTTLKVAQIPVTLPLATPIVNELTGVSADNNAINLVSPNYDAANIGPNIGVVFNNGTGSGATTVRLYNGYSPTTAAFPASPQYVIPYRCRSVAIFPATTAASTTGPVIVYSTDNNTAPYTTSLRFAAFDLTGSVVLASGLLISGFDNPAACDLITGVQTSQTGVGFDVYFGTVGPLATGKVTFNSSYAFTTETVWQRAVNPFGRAFAINGKSYVPLAYISPLQQTYFVSSSDKYYVAKALYQTAGPIPTDYTDDFGVFDWVMPMVASVTMLSPTKVRISCLEQANLIGNSITTATGVSALTFNFADSVHSFDNASLGGSVVFSGAIPQMYDGVSVVEDGFLIYPEKGTLTAVALGSGGNLSAGKYQYTVCYEWIDHQNRLHQSRPCEGFEVTTVNNDKVQLTVPYLSITNKRGDRPVQVVLYRTVADGSILYRITSLTAPNLNNVQQNSFTVYDTMSDAEIKTYPLLYDQFLAAAASGIPNELPNDPPPPTSIIKLHRNRLWCVDSTNPLQLWYSKEAAVDAPVQFTNLNTKQIDPRGGPISALASLDDKLLVFKQDHIFYLVGQGPTATGQNNDLSDAILVTADCGCVDPRSLVVTPIGVMFQSRKGIYLIDRSLQVQYIGAPVEAYNQEVITSATLLATTNQVRFTLESGKALVYDYFVQQWGTFTGLYAADSVVWQGAMTLARSNGQVLKETPGVYTDAGSPIQLKLTTAWLSFGQIQGFQRVRRALILGGWRSAHNLQIDVAVDFDSTIVQSAVASPTAPTFYGGSSPYGAGVYGGTFQLYQWRMDLARQKCQAVKFTIQDVPSATGDGEGVSLSSLAFEVGAKQGLNKVPASRIVS